MKFIKRIVLAVALVMTVGISAQAQFKFGVKAGIAANGLHFNKDILSTDNRCGFVGGVMTEFTVPIIGVGADLSVLYQHRTTTVNTELPDGSVRMRGDFIDIPLNLKYKLSLPGVGQFIAPFVTTGPDFSFRLSKKNLDSFINDKTCDVAWNVGLGAEIIKHIQIAASYGFGITNHASGNDALYSSHNRCWTVTAAYLF